MSDEANGVMKKKLVIDWFNTASYGKIFGSAAYADRAEKFLFHENPSIGLDWMRGKIDKRRAMELLSSELGITGYRLLCALEEGCLQWQFCDARIPMAIEMLREQGYEVVLATDNLDVFHEVVVPRLGLDTLFSCIISSCEVGCLKTDGKKHGDSFFERYLKISGVSCRGAIFFDDLADKEFYANHMDMEVINITRERTLISELSKFLVETPNG